VQWVRDLYMKDKVLVIKLTGRYLSKLLHKLANPSRQDGVDDAIHTLLDTYTRLYLAGQVATATTGADRHLRRKKGRKLAAEAAKQKQVAGA
jgi:hypothetical protein